MKTNHLLKWGLLLFVATMNLQFSSAFALDTAFTYQGRLNSAGTVANGTYDLQFALFDMANSGAKQGSTITSNTVPVSNGLFTVTLNFGNQFTGADRWLEIAVRTNGGGAFSTLAPRQQVLPTPYAIYSASANTAVNATNFSGNLSGDVTGMQSATVVANVGGQTATNVASGVSAANAANSANTANTIVKRDATGSFEAGNITATNFMGNGAGLTNLNVTVPTITRAINLPIYAMKKGPNNQGGAVGAGMYGNFNLDNTWDQEWIAMQTNNSVGNPSFVAISHLMIPPDYVSGGALRFTASAATTNAPFTSWIAAALITRAGNQQFSVGTNRFFFVGGTNADENLPLRRLYTVTMTTTNTLLPDDVLQIGLRQGSGVSNANVFGMEFIYTSSQ